MNLQSFFSGLDALYRNGQTEQVGEYLSAGLSRAQNECDFGAVVSISNELGGLYRVQGRFDAGIACFQNALGYIIGSPFAGTKEHGTTLLNYATLLTAMGDLAGAAERFTEAIEIWESLDSVDCYCIATLCNNLATLYLRQEQYDKALACTQRALTLLQDLPTSDDEAGVTHTVRAQIRMCTGEEYLAFEELEQAEQAFSRCPTASPIHMATAAQCRGELLLARQEWEAALDAYRHAEKLLRAGNVAGQSLAQLYSRQALCCRNLNREEEASVLKARCQTLKEGRSIP